MGCIILGGEALIKIECQRIIPECSIHDVNEVINIIRRLTHVEREDFNKDFSKIVVNNGILDLNTLKIKKHRKDHLSTIKLPIDYDQKARCPMFLKFLKECLPNPKDIITVIEEFANILTGNRENFDKTAMYIGVGRNGKSTFLKIVESVIGEENTSHVAIHEFSSDRFALADLHGKLANIHADITNRELNHLGKFKQMVSGDLMRAQKKGQHSFNFRPFAKPFFAANEMPSISDNTDSIYDRFLVTNWDNQFIGNQKIINLDRIIVEKEKAGIFNLILENYKTLLRNNRFRYEQPIAQVREKIKRESDKLLEFIQEQTKDTVGAYITKDQFFEIQNKFCHERNYDVYSKQKLGANLPTYGILDDSKKINGKTVRIWKNISWNKESEFIKNNVKGLDEYV